MTKFKVCAKIHLFIIISSLIIAIGMAVGTICHFVAGGFFNYGGEFASYNSVTVTYVSSEYSDEAELKQVCGASLDKFKPIEVSHTEAGIGGELVYKFTKNVSAESLQSAVAELNVALDKNGSGLNYARFAEGFVKEGGAKAITFASIAVASAVAFQFLYFILRYKLRAAFSALLASVHNLGIFVSLAAITRIPVGAELITLSALAVVVTIILTCVLFDRVRKNFREEKYAKTDRTEVVDISACEVRTITVYMLAGLACAALVFGVFASIAQLYIGAFAPYVLALMGLVACAYGLMFFTPAVHSAIDALCERVKTGSPAKKSKPAKADKKVGA